MFLIDLSALCLFRHIFEKKIEQFRLSMLLYFLQITSTTLMEIYDSLRIVSLQCFMLADLRLWEDIECKSCWLMKVQYACVTVGAHAVTRISDQCYFMSLSVLE